MYLKVTNYKLHTQNMTNILDHSSILCVKLSVKHTDELRQKRVMNVKVSYATRW
jgi:hypothetical protein